MTIGNTFWQQLKEDQYTYMAEGRGKKSIIDSIAYTEEMET